jgi:molybdate transport system regulatory protein
MAAKKAKSAKRSARSPRLSLGAGLWLGKEGQNFLGGRRIELLENIAEHGSISQAAKAAGLSYKGAWDMVDAINNLAEQPVVLRATGGQHGGGSSLTNYGKKIVKLYRELESGHRRVLGRMQAEIHDSGRLGDVLKNLSLKTSARNQLRGTVKAVHRGAVNADVLLDIGDGLEIAANITNEAIEELGLKCGRDAVALIKSSFVLLSTGPEPRISAGNRLPGAVIEIKKGAVNSEIKLQLSGGRTLIAIVTNPSVRELELQLGSKCHALVNASHVLIAVND